MTGEYNREGSDDEDLDKNESDNAEEGGVKNPDDMEDMDGIEVESIFKRMMDDGTFDRIHEELFREIGLELNQTMGIMDIECVMDSMVPEKVPGFSRMVAGVDMSGGRKKTGGSMIVNHLVNSLAPYEDKLLFGRIDDIYLNSSRTFVCYNGILSGSLRLYWDTSPTPYKLLIPDVSYISNNKEFIHLVVGDLVEELMNDLEKKD